MSKPMRFPIKFNRDFWPDFITKLMPSASDPRILCVQNRNSAAFINAVSSLRFGKTFKTTSKSRFPKTVLELNDLNFDKPVVILDVGASDGTTSLDIMNHIPFERYYVTDLNITVFYQVRGQVTWFYDEKGNCILMATDRWVNYPDLGGAFFPFNKISQNLFASAPKLDSNAQEVMLINSSLITGNKSNILIKRHNILDGWPFEKADLIIAANILNRVYFSTSDLELALLNLAAALNNFGRIAIIDNRPEEKATIFQIDQRIVRIEKRINGGTEIENLAQKSLEKYADQAANSPDLRQV